MAKRKKDAEPEMDAEEKEEVIAEPAADLPVEVKRELPKETPVFACHKCGGEMKVLKNVDNEKLWECSQCHYQHCKMR